MPDLFTTGPGTVTAVRSAGLPAADLFLDAWGPAESFNALLTGAAFAHEGAVQLMQTLDDRAYLYLFGEQAGELALSGVAFSRYCGPGTDRTRPQRHGLEHVREYYLQNRVSRTGAPVTVVFGLSAAFRAFLTGFRASANDPERGLGQFALRLIAVPELST